MQFVLESVSDLSALYTAIAVVVLSTLYYLYKNRGLPPGPTGLPFLGLWHELKSETCHLQLQEYGKKYGDIFSFTYVGKLMIHLGSVKVAREAHITKSDAFYQRPQGFNLLRYYLDGGIVFLESEGWKAVRKFFLMQFRERGMSTIKESLSGPMYDTIRETIGDLKKTNGKPVDIAALLLAKCNKIMRQTLFADDGMTEQEMRVFNENYFKNLSSMTSTNMMLTGTFARYFIFPFTKNFRQSCEGHSEMRRIMNEVIARRRATYDENNVRDCIDAFFKERKERESKNDPTAKYFKDEVMMISLLQIVGDGVLFMAMFIGAFLKAAVDHPEEQEKIYRELIEVVGKDRNPEMEDKNQLTYTNAFISEVMRTSDVFTLFFSLECMKETTVAGYRIPKGAVTVYNFWAAHMNPKDYVEPEKFNPSRFIVKDGEKKPDLLPLFGLGKRACMGEGFTMIQTFLFLTTILKNFRLTRPENEPNQSLLFFELDKINVCAHSRN